ILHRVVRRRASRWWTFVVHFAITNRDVAGPKASVVPRCGITTRRIICLYAIEGVFWFVDAVSMNSVPARIQLFAGRVAIVRIRENVETIDDDALGEMKANVIDDYALFRLGPNGERVLRIETIDTSRVRSRRQRRTRVAFLQVIGKRQR